MDSPDEIAGDIPSAQRAFNLIGVFVPPLAVIVAIPLLWGRFVDATALLVAAGFYMLTGFGVTIGYHRLLTHRSFATHKATENLLALAGSLSLQGSPVQWVSDHRKHHAHTDREGDPHSPHAGHGGGIAGAARGLWHAHVAWLWRTHGTADRRRFAPELVDDRWMRGLHRSYALLVLASLTLPFALGYAVTGTVRGALIVFLWAGLIRAVALHHITWSVNSVCHFFGRRRFATEDHSTNVAWLALPSLGEAWHNNHHAFSRSAYHGLRRREALLDPSGWIIRLMERLHLAWNVVAIAPERQAQRLAAPPAA